MIRLFVGIVIGGVIGFAWHKLVGCSGGACPITSNPYISIMWGAIMGALLTGFNNYF